MILEENSEAMARKHFLINGLDQGNITEKQYKEEMDLLEPFIEKNLAEYLAKNDELLKSEIHQVKQIVTQDGDLKRGIAKILIKFLEYGFTQSEIKGIMRQGYKIQRLK